jgi:hypothetical protein
MTIPIAGLIVVPISGLVYLFYPHRLAELAIFLGVFQAAAVANLGGGFAIGISPFFFVTILIGLRLVPQWLSGRVRFFREEPVAWHACVLAIFTLWGVFSAFLLPNLFTGLLVDAPRSGVDVTYYLQEPLHWTYSNAGQATYLILDFVLALELLQIAPQSGTLKRLAAAFSWSGILVVVVGFYQFLCPRFGMPFPTWIFNSNDAWGQNPNQFLGSFLRVSSTFLEPSEAAGFLSSWCIFELTLAIGNEHRSAWHLFWATFGSMVLVQTASTTGYVTASVMWGVLAWNCISSVMLYSRVKVKTSLALFAMMGGAIAGLVLIPNLGQVLELELLRKSQTGSALHRTATFGRAIGIFFHSWGLGVGLGSNRALSVFFWVLSNLGLPGIALFLYLLLNLYSMVRETLRQAATRSDRQVLLRALAFAFVANLLSQVSSGAEVTQPRLWILWSMMLVAIRHEWLARRSLLPRAVHAERPGSLLAEPLGLRSA